MFGLWAVARHTFRQCLRMKVAGVFIVLLAVALGAMPFIMKGDGTLSGQIRTFLSYAVSMTALLGSLVTIFLTAGMVTSDVRDKQIFSVATKPLARWRYIVGRWLGVVLFDAVLLGLAGGTIYGMAQYLRAGESPLESADARFEDRRKVENEVFAARRKVSPDPLDVDRAVEAEVYAMKQDGRFDDVMASYRSESNGDERLARTRLLADLHKRLSSSMQSVAPGKSLEWKFSGIHVKGAEARGTGRVVRVFSDAGLMVLETDSSMIARMIYGGPIRINNVEGRVERLARRKVVVRFGAEQMSYPAIGSLTAGKQVRIVAPPTFQISYKATPSATPPGKTLASIWEVQNPTSGAIYQLARNDPVRRQATLVVPADAVDDEGRTVVSYVNKPARSGFVTSVTILQDDVAILYRVGGFEGNFLRGVALIFIQLAFLAALGVMAGSFVSFPVACLICFAMLPFQMARGFLIDAVRPPTAVAERTVLDYLVHYVVKAMNVLLPDFGRTSPADAMVDGMNISWGFLGSTVLWALVLQTGILLAVACLIFHKRELARVQV